MPPAQHCWQPIRGNLGELSRFSQAGPCANRHSTLASAMTACLELEPCGGVTIDGGLKCAHGQLHAYSLRSNITVPPEGISSLLLHRTADYRVVMHHEKHREGRWCEGAPTDAAAVVPHSYLHMLPDFLRRPITVRPGPEPLRVLVLGGSMTAGSGCLDKSEWAAGYATSRECSWATRFGRLLARASGREVVVDNKAAAGTQSATAVAGIATLLGDASYDFIFSDFSVNDAAVRDCWLPLVPLSARCS